jgi:hypothetical protein
MANISVQIDIDNALAKLAENAEIVRICGFALDEPNLDPSPCNKLLADERFKQILYAIAEKYSKICVWRSFACHERTNKSDTFVSHLEESAWLDIEGDSTGSIDIDFILLTDNADGAVKAIIRLTVEPMQGMEAKKEYRDCWIIEEDGVEKTTFEILRHIDACVKRGFTGLYMEI